VKLISILKQRLTWLGTSIRPLKKEKNCLPVLNSDNDVFTFYLILMILEIITPDKKVYSGQVKLVQLPGVAGLFEILNNHAPIISTLEKGKIKVEEESGQVLYFEVEGGIVENKDNKIIVLAESV